MIRMMDSSLIHHIFQQVSSAANRYYAWFAALHTRVDVLFLGPQSEAEFSAIVESVHKCLVEVERMGNRFSPDSELSLAVAQAHLRPVVLTPSLASLLRRCLKANEETQGLFDITINTPDHTPQTIHDVVITPEGHLSLRRPGIVLDLSGILKGYALECLRPKLLASGITDALINLGNSSILVLGSACPDIPSGYCLTTSAGAPPERRHIRHPMTGQYVPPFRRISVLTKDGIEGEIQSIVSLLISMPCGLTKDVL